jgi:DNA repair photolyase
MSVWGGAMNKQKGNMYGFITHTWNPIKGKCIHDCSYCYMKKMYKRYKWDETIRLDEKCLNRSLGKNNFIFVGSATDMFAENVEKEWIRKVINKCEQNENEYLFQTKNTKRFGEFVYPVKTILATTLESNIIHEKNNAPLFSERVEGMLALKHNKNIRFMITIEPVIDFATDHFVKILKLINPFQINIGADSGHNNLVEPSTEKLKELIMRLDNTDIKVNLKDNLKRLL